jgi:hypothetical protein
MAHVATVTIDSDQVPADATNFPAYINLAHLFAGSESFASTVANGGGDIRVFQGATELAREVVSCDTSAETGELHVLIPFIDSSADTVLSIYADGSSADYAVDDPFGRNAVWGDYAAVVHGEGATDSTGNHTFTANGSPSTVAGKLGSALEVNSTNYYTAPDTAALGSATDDDFSYQWWHRFTDAGIDTDVRIIGQDDSTSGNWWSVGINSDVLSFTVDDGGTRNQVNDPADMDTALTATDWHSFFAVWKEGVGSEIYRDGVSVATSTAGTLGSSSNSFDLKIGGTSSGLHSGGSELIQLAEQRIRIGDPSANWITTEYNNQSDPSSFYTATDPNAGGSESISPASLYQSVSIEGVTLTQAHVLAAANLAQLQAIGAATLAQANSIAPHGVDQTAGIESATLTQAHIIAPAGISQHQQIGTASLVSAGVLSVIGLAQTQTLDEAILTVAGALDVDGVSQSQVLEALTLVQNNILAPAGLAQEAALEATTINAAALGITPAGIEQVMAIDPTGLTQYHVLAVSDLAQDQILEAARFGGLVIGELQGRIYVFAALDGDVYAIPALTGTIH